ncbi:Uma2 family endonuclease [uncultured Lamprocystis sp.]|jgi:Uma2 family endonuclease|uniref:Uma2 family endonuclease n=1 Tax=uncultured Lamprocystis sp. TaxID=543132 RepID=UPI0034414EAE
MTPNPRRHAVEAQRLKTIDDLLDCDDERVELIGGAIVRRPMARFEHSRAQSGLAFQVQSGQRPGDPDGWLILTEVSVRYSAHECPCHDLAGWRRARLGEWPTGIITLPPDWVCEILSPGHERKDLFHHLLLLPRAGVRHYWVLAPEDRSLIAYALDQGGYRIVCSAECRDDDHCPKVRIPPFEEIEIDPAELFGKRPAH